MRLFVIILLIAFFSCSDKKTSENILKPEKMQAVLWDYLRADAYANEILRLDTNLDLNLESAKLQQKVFYQHKISKDQFYTSLEYYKKNGQQLKDILDTIIVRQQRPVILPSASVDDTTAEKGVLKRKMLKDSIKSVE